METFFDIFIFRTCNTVRYITKILLVILISSTIWHSFKLTLQAKNKIRTTIYKYSKLKLLIMYPISAADEPKER